MPEPTHLQAIAILVTFRSKFEPEVNPDRDFLSTSELYPTLCRGL